MDFLLVIGVVAVFVFYIRSFSPDTPVLSPREYNEYLTENIKQRDKQAYDRKKHVSIFTEFLRHLDFNQEDINHYRTHYSLLSDKCHEVINTMPDVVRSLPRLSRKDLLDIRRRVQLVFDKEIRKYNELTNALHAANGDMYKHILDSHLTEEEREQAKVLETPVPTAQRLRDTSVGFINDKVHVVSAPPVFVPELALGDNMILNDNPLFESMVTREHMKISFMGELLEVKANVHVVDILDRLSKPYPKAKDARVLLVGNILHICPKED